MYLQLYVSGTVSAANALAALRQQCHQYFSRHLICIGTFYDFTIQENCPRIDGNKDNLFCKQEHNASREEEEEK